jgi:hypothetical protein
MDANDLTKATRLVNSWASAFRAECEEQFPENGDLMFHSAIVALYCELFRPFGLELICEQTNARLAGAQLPCRIVIS